MSELMPGNGNYYGANHPNMSAEDRQIEATLAVAFEQRTANLIAYQTNALTSYAQAPKVPHSEQMNALNETIKERMGL